MKKSNILVAGLIACFFANTKLQAQFYFGTNVEIQIKAAKSIEVKMINKYEKQTKNSFKKNNRRIQDIPVYSISGCLGYEYQFGSMTFGIEGTFGNYHFSCQLKKQAFDESTKSRKQTLFVGIMPKIAYFIAPRTSAFLCAGVLYVKDRFNTENFEKRTDKGKFHPVVGFGFKINITQHFYCKVEYNYVLKSKHIHNIALTDNKKAASHDEHFDHSSHVVKFGVGYMF